MTDFPGEGNVLVHAWRIEKHGEPRDVLRRTKIEVPAPAAQEVAVTIDAIGLNFLDVSSCRGDYAYQPSLPMIPGAEFVGTVAAVGSGVEAVTVGDRVTATSSSAQGGFAGKAIVPADSARPVPPEMPDEHAAALVVTYQTAFLALIRRAALQAGEWVLVQAAGGGVGSAAVQLSRLWGAHVVATADTAAKLDLCRAEGADVVVDVRAEDFVACALEATGGRGVDVVFDPVGGDVFSRSLDCAAFEARMIPIGWAGGTRPRLTPEDVLGRNLTVVGLAWGTGYPAHRPELVRDAHEELLAHYATGAVRPIVPKVWSFDELPQALQALADGEVAGKAVVLGPSR